MNLFKRKPKTPKFSKEFLQLGENVWSSMYYCCYGKDEMDKVWTIDMIKNHFRGYIMSHFRYKNVSEIPESAEVAMDAYIKMKMGDAVAGSFASCPI